MTISIWLAVPLCLISAGVAAAVSARIWGRRVEKRTRMLEQTSQRAERAEETATLTRGLAHEIKNPLSTIGLNVRLLDEDIQHVQTVVGPRSALSQELDQIRRRFTRVSAETQRLADILEDFLRFAGRLDLALEDCAINALLEEVAAFFEPQTMDAGVALRVQPSESEISVPLDRRMIKQVLFNLMLNALQAMEDAASEPPQTGSREMILKAERQDDCVRIHVIDTGPGIPADKVLEIFRPYVTGKRTGTGLGLPTARRIAEAHGGSLSLVSEPGHGSDFILSLPCKISIHP